MPPVKINARDLVLEVQDPEDAATWVEVGGLTAAKPNLGENEETAETTTYASKGQYEQEVMQRGATLELEGFEMKDPDTGEMDPGQAACYAWAARLATESLGPVRFRHPMDTEWKRWTATFTVGETGGEINDKSTFEMTMTRSGPSSTMALDPAAP